MKKIIISISILFVFSMLFSLTSLAASNLPLRVVVNGEKISFPDAQPFIDGNSRTQVPVRFISESMGSSVNWAASTKTVTVTQNSKKIVLVVGKKDYTVNNTKKVMDTAALIKESRTFVPLRFVSEALGATVKWDSAVKTVYIDTKTPSIASRYNGYTIPENTQLTFSGGDDILDQSFIISFLKQNADVKQQAIDVKNAIESKLGSKTANDVYNHIKSKVTPDVAISEKFLKDDKTKQLIWIKVSPSGSRTVDIFIYVPGYER